MSGINKYEGKDRRRQRLRNHVTRDPKYGQKIAKDRRRRFIDNENDGVFYEDRYYDDNTDYE